MATNNTPNEEVDLGQLFKVIGNGFRNFFNAIGNFIKKIFHYIILSLIFVKKNILYLGAATLIGGVLGYVLEINNKPYYKSEMILKTNYGSAKRLYNQRKYINTLVSDEDSLALAKYFDIKPTEASKIIGFEVEPFEKEKNLLKNFDYYMERRDTNYIKDFSYKDFVKRTSDDDLRFQQITFYSYDKDLFTKLSKGIKNGIENEYYKNIQEKTTNALKLKRNRLEKDLSEIDSLRQNYRKVALTESAKNPGGTNINLSTRNVGRNKNDIDLFESSQEILIRLAKLEKEEERSGKIATVISDFSGSKEPNEIRYKKWFRYGILGFALMTLFILGKRFNKYLENYNK